MGLGGPTRSDLEASWRDPRWWQKLHGLDEKNYLTWYAAFAIASGILAVALGLTLLVTTKHLAIGAGLAFIGSMATLSGVWSLKRGR